MQIQAAVLEKTNSRLIVEDVELEDPHPGEVLIKIVSSSICHTDIRGIEGLYESLMLPAVLGHESAGIVERLGDGVTKVKRGDHVIPSVLVACKHCRNCYSSRYYACEKFSQIAFQGILPGGGKRLSSTKKQEKISHFFAHSSFATHAVVPETIVVPIFPEVPLDRLSPLSCGVQTGAGAVMNSGMALGSTFAIFGCGGVGLSAVMGARAIGASEIIALDVLDERLELALELGATRTMNTKQILNAHKEIKNLTGGGVDCAIECIGRKETVMQAISSTREFGTTILVGIAPEDTKLELGFFTLFNRTVKGCVAGYANSDIFIPYLLKLHTQGRLPFEKLSPKIYPLDQINEAIDDMASGRVIKPLLRIG